MLEVGSPGLGSMPHSTACSRGRLSAQCLIGWKACELFVLCLHCPLNLHALGTVLRAACGAPCGEVAASGGVLPGGNLTICLSQSFRRTFQMVLRCAGTHSACAAPADKSASSLQAQGTARASANEPVESASVIGPQRCAVR